MLKKLSIIGCGGHARSVIDVVIDNSQEVSISVFDENARDGEKIMGGGYSVFPLSSLSLTNDESVFVAIGDNQKRKEIAEQLCDRFNVSSVISKRAYISRFSSIGIGSLVGDGAHIGPETKIGRYCIINTQAVVEHEVQIGDYCHISVNSSVCGRCKIGDLVFIGAGAVVRDKISICSNVTVGANSVVVKSIDSPGIYVGNPARLISQN